MPVLQTKNRGLLVAVIFIKAIVDKFFLSAFKFYIILGGKCLNKGLYLIMNSRNLAQ